MTSVGLAHQQCGEQVWSVVGNFNLLVAILKQDFDGSQDWVIATPAEAVRIRSVA